MQIPSQMFHLLARTALPRRSNRCLWHNVVPPGTLRCFHLLRNKHDKHWPKYSSRAAFGSPIARSFALAGTRPAAVGALGGRVAVFVLILVAVVVAQTWFDWRDTKRVRVIPEWAKGVALGGLLAVSLAAATSVAAVWLREDAGQWSGALNSRLIWPEVVFVIGR